MQTSVKNNKVYKKIDIEAKAIKSAYAKRKKAKKHPTSISLPEEIVVELKRVGRSESKKEL
jgi:hypothetical protein